MTVMYGVFNKRVYYYYYWIVNEFLNNDFV